MPENNYTLIFSLLVQEAISQIVAKHQLSLNERVEVFDGVTTKDIEVFIFRVARKILNREGSFKDICEKLRANLKINQKDAENLAHDIKNNVVTLTEMEKPEEEIEEQNEENEELERETDEQEKKEAFAKAKEELMRKIGAKRTEETITKKQETNTPGAVKPVIVDVEENAKKIEQERKPMASSNKEPMTPQAPTQEKKADPYKEPIE